MGAARPTHICGDTMYLSFHRFLPDQGRVSGSFPKSERKVCNQEVPFVCEDPNGARSNDSIATRTKKSLGCRSESSSRSTDLHGGTILHPCVLRHIRRSGFKDDFSHSYLYVGVPVGLHASYVPLISVDQPSSKVLFSIRPQHQALRGGVHMSLAEKLEEYLISQVSFTSITKRLWLNF